MVGFGSKMVGFGWQKEIQIWIRGLRKILKLSDFALILGGRFQSRNVLLVGRKKSNGYNVQKNFAKKHGDVELTHGKLRVLEPISLNLSKAAQLLICQLNFNHWFKFKDYWRVWISEVVGSFKFITFGLVLQYSDAIFNVFWNRDKNMTGIITIQTGFIMFQLVSRFSYILSPSPLIL